MSLIGQILGMHLLGFEPTLGPEIQSSNAAGTQCTSAVNISKELDKIYVRTFIKHRNFNFSAF